MLDNPYHRSFFVLKLWSYFIPSPPSAATQAALEELYVSSGRMIGPVVEAILLHPDLYDGAPLVKPPAVYNAGLLRATGQTITSEAWVWLGDMSGQQLFYPPNVAGWNDRAWLDTSRLYGRWYLANQVLQIAERTSAHYSGSTETGAEALAAAIAHVGNPVLTQETVAVLPGARRHALRRATWRATGRCARTRCGSSSPPHPTSRSAEELLMADCCDDFTRSHLLRASVASAGAGLPVVETGMPLPAGTGLTRRSMLLRSAGLALAVYGAGKTLTPQAFEAAVAEAAGDHKVLISIFMDGGADALSLLAPVNDARYIALRPTLRMLPGSGPVFEGDTRLEWHPSAQGFKELWDDPGVGLAVAPAIGYASPNQSHFTSRHFWEVGATDVSATTGWLGRYLDRVGSPNVPIQGLSLDNSLSPQLATSSVAVAATDNLSGYRFQARGVWGTVETRMRTAYGALGAAAVAGPDHRAGAPGADQRVPAVGRPRVGDRRHPAGRRELPGGEQHVQDAPAVDRAAAGDDQRRRPPAGALHHAQRAGRLRHALQPGDAVLDNMLGTAANIRAFWNDLVLRGLDDRVVITVWSEFGRRLAENGSGTDHGAAGTAFVIGKTVRQGLIGEFPGLAAGTGVDTSGNVRATADFRGLYCSLLEGWFQTEAEGIIPSAASFARPTLF